MTQLFLTPGGVGVLQSATVQTAATVSGTANSSGLIKIATSAPHGLVTGDIVQNSGITGTVEANGQWVVTVVDTTHFTLNNSTYANAYSSGGSVAHVGHACPGVTVDETVFVDSISLDASIIVRIASAPVGVPCRFVIEDSADTAFETAMPVMACGFAGGFSAGHDSRVKRSVYDVADVRTGSSGDTMRVKIMFPSAAAGSVFSFVSWIEY